MGGVASQQDELAGPSACCYGGCSQGGGGHSTWGALHPGFWAMRTSSRELCSHPLVANAWFLLIIFVRKQVPFGVLPVMVWAKTSQLVQWLSTFRNAPHGFAFLVPSQLERQFLFSFLPLNLHTCFTCHLSKMWKVIHFEQTRTGWVGDTLLLTLQRCGDSPEGHKVGTGELCLIFPLGGGVQGGCFWGRQRGRDDTQGNCGKAGGSCLTQHPEGRELTFPWDLFLRGNWWAGL